MPTCYLSFSPSKHLLKSKSLPLGWVQAYIHWALAFTQVGVVVVNHVTIVAMDMGCWRNFGLYGNRLRSTHCRELLYLKLCQLINYYLILTMTIYIILLPLGILKKVSFNSIVHGWSQKGDLLRLKEKQKSMNAMKQSFCVLFFILHSNVIRLTLSILWQQ